MSLEEKYKAEAERDLPAYTIGCEIGRGVRSIVYSAQCSSGILRGRVVAVKKIFAGANHSTETLHRSLFHPNIVSLLATPSGYHVLEYCPQGTLQDRLKLSPENKLSEGELRGVVKGLVDGLTYLSKERVIHRDIKPANIYLSGEWRVKIADFSSAIRLESASQTNTDVMNRRYPGSWFYRSPEILCERPHGFPTDMWSVGALMLACLTGAIQVLATNPNGTNSEIYKNAHRIPPETSEELRDLVLDLLTIDPKKRITIEQIPSHPFLDPSLPVVPLDSHVLHLTVTQPTPSQVVPSSLAPRPSRYPAHLSKAPPLNPLTTPAPESDPAQPLRNFLSDTWKPRQPGLTELVDRRITSLPTSASDSTGNSTFSLLKREDIAIRRIASSSRLSSVWSTATAAATSTSTGASGSALDSRRLVTSGKHGTNTSVAPSSSHSDAALSDYDSDSSGTDDPPKKSSEPLIPNFLEFKARMTKLPAKMPLVPPSLASSTSSATTSLCTAPSAFALPRDNSRKLGENPENRKNTFDWGNLSSILRSPSLRASGFGADQVATKESSPVRELPFPFTRSSSQSQDAHTLKPSTEPTKEPNSKPPSTQPAPNTKADGDNSGSKAPILPTEALPNPNSTLGTPVDSTKPAVLNTEYLSPGTYKTMKGQVTVLHSSRSLLVDFREGERRKGRKGDEVIVIAPDGYTIKVYSAPHLSTPCCLAEPNAEYTFEAMPKEYWNRYADAWRAVYQLKQRIPKLVQYKPNAKCTLMANEPFGDVEVVYTPSSESVGARSGSTISTPYINTKIKLRLRQDRRTLEITRSFIPPPEAFVLDANSAPPHAILMSKKVLPVVRAGYAMVLVALYEMGGAAVGGVGVGGTGSDGVLDEEEAEGVKVLRRFLGVCRAVVGVETEEGEGGEGEKSGDRKLVEGTPNGNEDKEAGEAEETGQTEACMGGGGDDSKRPTAASKATGKAGAASPGFTFDACVARKPAPNKLMETEVANPAAVPSSSNLSVAAAAPVSMDNSGSLIPKESQNKNDLKNNKAVGSFAQAVVNLKAKIPTRPARFASGSWRSRTSTGASSSSGEH
ncbi:hypothetical protein BC629DRAFT_1591587 [Irpex lacteus]|nr:hypothetical protein BC629DRAFT_1591587 [Irpex lacteus]